ncbi:uncharacterized protein LOC110181823 [Drosophila serrata]|uniref:uncharacterized protein LOC110181823 n=1 Tax=Drosophila serrata TaxID=7274 RepID=UPI000A1CFF3C|nr:uncharacterized protein LOC110181823 [Drosophila serrata]
MANSIDKAMSIFDAAAEAEGELTPRPSQPQPAALGPQSRKLKLIGCCPMTDKQMEEHYKLHHISDDELATVGIQRSSLIDDYRLMHEISQKRQLKLKQEKKPNINDPAEDREQRIKELQLRLGIRPHKAYKFQLLNQLVRVMDTEPDPKIIFPETQFNFFSIYCENDEVRLLSPKERERRRFDAFYDHLDNMFVNGDRNKAIDLVVDAFVRLKKRRMQVSQVPIPRGYMSPRSFDLIPRY